LTVWRPFSPLPATASRNERCASSCTVDTRLRFFHFQVAGAPHGSCCAINKRINKKAVSMRPKRLLRCNGATTTTRLPTERNGELSCAGPRERPARIPPTSWLKATGAYSHHVCVHTEYSPSPATSQHQPEQASTNFPRVPHFPPLPPLLQEYHRWEEETGEGLLAPFGCAAPGSIVHPG
jgi:hypothetical protein